MKFELSYLIQRNSKPDIRFQMKQSYALNDGILGVFGQSGTGKTSFLKALAGLIPNASYSISLDNHHYQNIAAAKNPCVYVGADTVLFDHINVLANLTLVIKHSESASKRRLNLNEVVSLCAIDHLLEQPVVALSSGEKQRVVFARALLSGKQLILLDEAFSALDWSARLYFIELIKTLKTNHNISFILVSHSLKELALACKHIWVLQEGKFVLQADVNIALDTVILGIANVELDPQLKIEKNKKYNAQNTHFQTVDYQQNLTMAEYSETLFSVLSMSYIKRDELDEQLEIWQLASFEEAPAQQIIKRCAMSDKLTSGNEAMLRNVSSIVIEADKISLTYEKNTQSSMLNCLDVTVIGIDEISTKSPGFPSGIVIKLSANGQIIRSFISKRSFVHMQINMDDNLFAIFKAL
ncbi:MAG: ABC-type molybdate transport system ATPase subunit [Paraglaciecola sp.]|jgi:ABC-type molybdate transport system ATPase subunit